jgi:hypothetical protein
MPRSQRGRTTAGALCALSALSVLAVAGCGGQASLAPAQPPHTTQPLQTAQPPAPAGTTLSGVRACALIPKATVTALGQLDAPAAPSPDGLTCFYNLSGGPSYILDVIQRSQYELTKTIDTSEANAGLVQLTRTHGLGDEGFAISSTSGGPVYNVIAAKGGLAVMFMVNSVEPANERRADQLVAAALAGL